MVVRSPWWLLRLPASRPARLPLGWSISLLTSRVGTAPARSDRARLRLGLTSSAPEPSTNQRETLGPSPSSGQQQHRATGVTTNLFDRRPAPIIRLTTRRACSRPPETPDNLTGRQGIAASQPWRLLIDSGLVAVFQVTRRAIGHAADEPLGNVLNPSRSDRVQWSAIPLPSGA